MAVDQHQYDLLFKIFTSDATINYNTPDGAIVTGVDALTDRLTTRLQNIKSTHNQSTNYIDFSSLPMRIPLSMVSVRSLEAVTSKGRSIPVIAGKSKKRYVLVPSSISIIVKISLDMRMIW